MSPSTWLGIQKASHTTGVGQPGGRGSVSYGSPQADTGSMQSGQTLQGTVISAKGNEVVLSLENGSLLHAKLEQGVPVSEGQLMTFEVRSNTGTRLALSPLYENRGQDPNVQKALNAAGMPETAKNIRMVSALMQEGLSVNRYSLQEFGRQMMLYPGADPVTLAQMDRLQIPVTPEHIAQFEAYQNYEHQISQSILEIGEGLTDAFSQMVRQGDAVCGVKLYQQVLSLFTEEGLAKPAQGVPEQGMAGTGEVWVMHAVSAGTDGEVGAGGISRMLPEGVPGKAGEMQSDLSGGAEISQGAGKADSAEGELALWRASGQPEEWGEAAGGEDTKIPDGAQGREVSGGSGTGIFEVLLELGEGDRVSLAQHLAEAGFPETFTEKVSSGKISQSALLQEIARALSEYPELLDHQKLPQVFDSKEYQAVFKNEIGRQWLLQPEEVAGDRQVEELYRRLDEQTTRLTRVLSQAAGAAHTPVASAAQNLSNNLHFIHQLNQMFTYLQLPLKMNGKSTHGELYVYTNKKNLAKQDGNVSALLHLDMAHLGPLDIHVTMQEKSVSTKFYLQDDHTIDLVANHIPMLNERLQKRGYSLSSEFLPRDREKTSMEEMLDANKNVPILANYSFDARA